MIHGCAAGSAGGADIQLAPPVIVDLTATRCIKPDRRARVEATLTVQAPKPDTTGADGSQAVSKGRWKAKSDEFRAAIARKNATIERLIDEADTCVGVSAPSATS